MSTLRHLIFGAALLASAAPAYAETCLKNTRFKEGAGRDSFMRRSDDLALEIRIERGECKVRLDARGDFTVREALDSFTKLDAGGYVELAEKDSVRERKLRVTNEGGRLRHVWSVDGDEGFDIDRERWLADMLLSIERGTGMFAKTRVPALLRAGGPEAVLRETELLSSDNARRTYYNVLLTGVTLAEALLERVVKHTGDSMTSDYERAEVLSLVARSREMTDRVANETIAVAARMNSDYEKRRVLAAALESVSSAASRKALFQAASTIGSSYELAELLIAAQTRGMVDSVSSDAYFRAVTKIGSDYERRRTLSSLLKQRVDSPDITANVLEASGSIRSDFELASLLVELARIAPITGDLRELYLRRAKTIQSDFEYRRALEALLGGKNG